MADEREIYLATVESHIEPDSSHFVNGDRFLRLLQDLERRGEKLPVFDWGSRGEAAAQSLQRHEAHVVESLKLSAGLVVGDPGIERYLKSTPSRLRRLGAGLCDLYGNSVRILPEVTPLMTDAYRYVSGYPDSLVYMLSANPERDRYAELPPYLGSYALVLMSEQPRYRKPPHRIGENFDDVSPLDFMPESTQADHNVV